MKTKAKTEVTAEPGRQELFVARDFDASREMLFRAHIDPKLFARWFGCREMTTVIDYFEASNGGRFRYLQSLPGHGEFASRGVFHEVAASERIVRTLEFEGRPGHVLLETVRFEALPGNRTRVITQSVFQSVEDRDGMLQAGVEKGAGEAFERLEEVLRNP